MSKFLTLLFFFILISCFLQPLAAAPTNKVAIIIDDIGYRYTDKAVLSLPGEITYSILPHTPFGKTLAEQANAQNKEVLLHIPMEAENGKKLGPGALTSQMSQAQIMASLRASLQEIPFAIGINNHMGSYLTQLSDPMIWTMNFLKQHQLLFLDSKTSPHSKAANIAKITGVPVKNRHIFLDNHLSQEYIKKQFQLLIKQAKSQDIVAIAHPHPETMQALQQLIPTLKQNNIELVPLSTLYSAQLAKQKYLLAAE